MDQPKRQMSDLGPSRPSARPASSRQPLPGRGPARPSARAVPSALRHGGDSTVQAAPHAPMPGSAASRAVVLRKQAEYQARVAAAYQGRGVPIPPTQRSNPTNNSSSPRPQSRTRPADPADAVLVDPNYAQAPLHPLPHAMASPLSGDPAVPAPGYAEPLFPPAPAKRKLFGRKSKPAPASDGYLLDQHATEWQAQEDSLSSTPTVLVDEPAKVIDDAFFDADEPEAIEPSPMPLPRSLPDVPLQSYFEDPISAGAIPPPHQLANPAAPLQMRLAPPPRRKGLLVAAQLFLSLIIILGVAIAIVGVYVRYYQ